MTIARRRLNISLAVFPILLKSLHLFAQQKFRSSREVLNVVRVMLGRE